MASGTPSATIKRWSSSLGSAVISFGDQQLVTGTSLLVAGFSQLPLGIATYHWQSVVNQAWFSTVTHLITLTAMKDDFDMSRRRNPLTIIRFVSMGLLILMLIVALYPMGYITSNTQYTEGFPAWCYFHKDLQWRYNAAWQTSYQSATETDQWETTERSPYNRGYYSSMATAGLSFRTVQGLDVCEREKIDNPAPQQKPKRESSLRVIHDLSLFGCFGDQLKRALLIDLLGGK
ncbi:hypothetical protein HYFRA_00007398 [Hymenoscyphus fraxineus]|uniref:Uncharacterized protein n=1 Tax=Hymenoscyphus fraxineus TaxID=746836 RepID=A0A9N9KT13_9HELO|nr:hypothetical protein HYFRA_00007398 [Hymenoscyphus fraxineus]